MKKILLSSLLLIATSAAVAVPIDYSVNRTIGGGTVVGDIVTDGASGVLTQADILGWTLALNDGGGTFTLFGPTTGNNSQLLLSGTAITATSTALTFNYGGSGFALFQAPNTGSGMTFWCQESVGANCTGGGVGEDVDVHTAFPGIHVARTGSVVFGTAGTTAVPEPETIGLVGLGLTALALSRRRKSKV